MKRTIRRDSSRTRRSGLVELHTLESRTLLSAAVGLAAGSSPAVSHAITAVAATNYDLVPSVTSLPKITGTLVAGNTITGTVNVTIANQGAGASPAGLQVTAVLRPVSGGADINLLAKPAVVGAVASKKTASVTLNLSIPTSVPAGTYRIVVTADPTNTFGEANNSWVAPITLHLAAGVINLSASLTSSKAAMTIVAGTATKASTVSFSISNLGNIPTTLVSAVRASVVLRPVGGGSDITIVPSAKYSLATLKAASGGAGAAKDTYTITIPALSAATTALIPAGSYTVVVLVTPVSVLTLPTITLTGPTVKVTGGTTTTGSVFKHGDVITFTADTQLTGTNFLERGAFVTNLHVTGSYAFTPLGLVLTYNNGGGTDTSTFAFTGAQDFLDPVLNGVGQVVTFSFNSAGAFMSLPNHGTGTQTAFAKYG